MQKANIAYWIKSIKANFIFLCGEKSRIDAISRANSNAAYEVFPQTS